MKRKWKFKSHHKKREISLCRYYDKGAPIIMDLYSPRTHSRMLSKAEDAKKERRKNKGRIKSNKKWRKMNRL